MRYCYSLLMGLLFTVSASGQTTMLDAIELTPGLGLLQVEDVEDARPTVGEPFAEGTWTFQTYGSGTIGDEKKGHIYTLHAGVGYYFRDNLSINVEGIAGVVDAVRDDDGVVAGFDLLLRWHFARGENWSLYLDGGAGFQQADTNFPSDSHHNFRPQIGVGGTWRVCKDWRLMGGVRWLHISNAHTSEHNDGLDAAQVYGGLMLPF